MPNKQELRTMQDVADLQVESNRLFFSANHDEIVRGETTDVYFVKTREILNRLGKGGTPVVAEIFTSREGVLAGMDECLNLLKGRGVEVWGLPEGEEFSQKEVIMRIIGPYDAFGLYETALLGFLASSSGWATAARECRRAVPDTPFTCFGARHVHPAVAPVMERAALIGGADAASCILAAKLKGREPTGTVPHAIFLIVGDTVEVAKAYDEFMPSQAPRLILVDTFKDEAEEALRVAGALQEKLQGIRLDTPKERGGVTAGLVRELRARLDQAGYRHVKIFASGGLTPERMSELRAAGVDAFGVGSYISAAAPIDMTMDLKEVDGKPIAKRGRIPGITDNPRLKKML